MSKRKVKEKQGFRTFDVIGVLILLSVVISVISFILLNSVTDHEQEKAIRKSRMLATQIYELGLKSNLNSENNSEQRKLASENSGFKSPIGLEGEIGIDPWGQAFNFKVILTNKGQPVYIAVWSNGPNSKSETSNDDLKTTESGLLARRFFQGDDLGYFQKIKEM